MIKKKDGKTKPTIQALNKVVLNYKMKKRARGRPKGARATTKAEDKNIMLKFHKLRPPGYGIDSNALHRALPAPIKRKLGRKTIIRRLGEKGYTAQKKMNKAGQTEKQRAKKLKFCKKYKNWKALQWQSHIQAVGDAKDFTWYPKELQPRFKKLRAPWTYMTKKERIKPAFQRPKRWFPGKDWKKVKKQKVMGFTSSNGKQLAFLVPSPWSSAIWARFIKSKLAPWLKKVFPQKTSYKILLDSEPLLHGPEAKAAFREANISVLAGWPKYCPDLNPQENVWSKAEPALRQSETGKESFEAWKEKLVPAIYKYAAPEKLVASMEKRIRQVLERDGGMADY